jgi:hypothetical protein
MTVWWGSFRRRTSTSRIVMPGAIAKLAAVKVFKCERHDEPEAAISAGDRDSLVGFPWRGTNVTTRTEKATATTAR